MGPMPIWQEWFCIAFICSLGCEKLRELFSSEPVGATQKLAVRIDQSHISFVLNIIFILGLVMEHVEPL